ncbi:Rv2578c family radical SAM protein [Agrococcus sp. SGAir0287]|uniref:Rv2578c family radical SAM protein n=1 Tax=Agrococcus sp. SGAir0287 TaxID=2070347 RepID=UPI0010CD2290|nr:Rv2578c family radical SAM protein [Agrococcus sp. SGAir0287]QCR19011.1 radical SAM protein [Agrococcus sp. SGAir0287]
MRWEAQQATHVDADALPGLEERGATLERWPTPGFDGMAFLEVTARSALNHVRGGVLGDTWTINPYRGCQHACVYCFARDTHRYLDLDAGADFDTRIVVKANVVEVLERELRTTRHGVDRVHLGTNTDPYQRAEGRYRLMPGILRALAAHGAAIAILTKGTLLRRDLPLLAEIAREVPVSIAMSIAIFDDALQQSVEPGTPSTAARLATVRAVREAGLDCEVFLMPILPGLTDTRAHLERAYAAIAEAGATSAATTTLHLRPGAREWYLRWLQAEHPHLLEQYRRIYGGGTTARRDYRDWLRARTTPLARRHGLLRTRVADGTGTNVVANARPSGARQLPSTTATPAAVPLPLF